MDNKVYLNIKQLGYDEKLIDFTCADNCVEEKGLYKLDDTSFILLVPDYISDSTSLLYEDITTTCSSLRYETKTHKSGAPETRLTHYVGPSYTYGDITHKTNHDWPAMLIKLKAKLEGDFTCPLNSALINRYDRNHYIPFHKDDENSLLHSTIVSYSMGDTKNIHFKNDQTGKTMQFKLKPNTLMVMGGDINVNWRHSVPKTNAKGQRFNITFRFIDPEAARGNTSEHCAKDTLDLLLQEMKTLNSKIQSYQKRIEVLESQQVNVQRRVDTPNERHTNPETENPHQYENRQVVLFDKDIAANRYACTELFNKQLSEGEKVSVYDISNVQDHRLKKGPLIVSFTRLSTKLKILKQKPNIPVSDYLSSKQTKLRKEARSLKEKKLIKNFWIYKGEVYYSLTDSEERFAADSEAFKKLIEESGLSEQPESK